MTKTSFALQALAGGAIGGFVGVAVIMFMGHERLSPQDYLPLALGCIYLLTALTVWVNPYIRKTAQPGERLWKRALLALLHAAAIAAPVLVPRSVNPVLAYVLVVAVYLASGLLMRQLMKKLDELMQRVVTDTNEATLSVLLAGLFLYGAAERMGFLDKGASIWVLYSIVMFFQFIWTQVAWMRRGLGNPAVPEE